MGYNVSQCSSKFKMKKENVPAAWAALKEYCKQPCEFKSLQNWVQKAAAQSCFEDSLGVFDFAIGSSPSAKGDYDEIEFVSETWSGYEVDHLSSIAPFVEEGSYIEFHGEDGEMWRIVFSAGKATAIRPTIFWDNPLDDIHYLIARLYDYYEDYGSEPLELSDFCVLSEKYKFAPRNHKEINEFYEEYHKKNPEIINRKCTNSNIRR